MTEILIRVTGYHKKSGEEHVFEVTSYKDEYDYMDEEELEAEMNQFRKDYRDHISQTIHRVDASMNFGPWVVYSNDYSWFHVDVKEN